MRKGILRKIKKNQQPIDANGFSVESGISLIKLEENKSDAENFLVRESNQSKFHFQLTNASWEHVNETNSLCHNGPSAQLSWQKYTSNRHGYLPTL